MYQSYMIPLSEGQKKKLLRAVEKKTPVVLEMSAKQLASGGDIPAFLTKTQIARIERMKLAGLGMQLKFSAKQLAAQKKEGGFLPALIPLLAAIGTAIAGGVAGATATYATNKAIKGIEGAVEKKKKKKQQITQDLLAQAMESAPTGSGLMPLGSGLFPMGVKP